jgi:hypothetical protein
MNKIIRNLFLCIIPLTILAFICASCKQSQLAGSWSRLDSPTKFKDLKFGKLGDLTLKDDSTFIIHGDSSMSDSKISGWHVGDERRGVWELGADNRLFLLFEPLDEKIFVQFKIVRLEKNKLVLKTLVSDNYIEYIRK